MTLVTGNFNLKQNRSALSALASSLENELDISLDEKTWETIQTYSDLKDACDRVFLMQGTSEEEQE